MAKPNLTPCALDTDDESPSDELRALADACESGNVEGVLVAYVTSDGSVRYKMMGALADEENLGNVATIAGELKRRIHMRIALSA